MKLRTIFLAACICCGFTAGVGMAQGTAQGFEAEDGFYTLGTGGGPNTRVTRANTSNALLINGAVYLFDVGDGVQTQFTKAGMILPQVRGIFISHHHIDHNADLGPIMANRWAQSFFAPLPVFGPPGTVEMVDHLAKAYRSIELAPISVGGPPAPAMRETIVAEDLPAETDAPVLIFEDENIRVSTVTNTHYNYKEGSASDTHSRAYSYRIEAAGRTILYTGDTGPSDNVLALAQGADLLVSEVIDIEAVGYTLRTYAQVPEAIIGGVLEHLRLDHLTSQQVGELAKAAGVKEIVLTHLVPGLDPAIERGDYDTGAKAVFDGKVTIANDLDRW